MACLNFRVSPVDGKGLGAVATKPIAQGDWVLEDDPALLRLSTEDVAHFDERWPAGGRRSEEYLLAREEHFESVLQAQLQQLPDDQQQRILALHSRRGCQGLADIFFTNALPTEEEDWVLCGTASRFNSSCQQNAVYQWSEERHCATIRAVWDIPVGEEISVFYGSTSQLLSPTAERREFLSFWGFTCCCGSCTDSASDDRRARIRELSARLDSPAVGSFRSTEVYSLAVERLHLYEAEKLFFAGFFRALAACVELSEAAGAPRAERQRWAERALKHARLFHADDTTLLDRCAAAVEELDREDPEVLAMAKEDAERAAANADEVDCVEAFVLDDDFDYDNCPLSVPQFPYDQRPRPTPPPCMGKVRQWLSGFMLTAPPIQQET